MEIRLDERMLNIYAPDYSFKSPPLPSISYSDRRFKPACCEPELIFQARKPERAPEHGAGTRIQAIK